MKYTKPKTILLTAILLLTSCTPAENPPLPDNSRPPVSETSSETSLSDAQSTSAAPKKETELMTTTSKTPETAPPVSETTSEEEEIPVPPEAPGSVPDTYREDGENGIKIIGRNGHYMGLMGCWGTLELCGEYAEALNRAAEALPNTKVYNMVIPTSSEFYTPDDVTGFTASQKKKIDSISEGLVNVTDADVYSALSAHLEEPIYTRTDHHWQPLGAYYAAEVFSSAAEVNDKFPSLSQYTKVTKNGYMGSLYNYSKSANLYGDPETFTLYISPNDKALKTTYYDTAFKNGYESDLFVSRDAGAYYCSFLGSDDRIAEIKTDCDNGRTLVIFKESYGNALVPFLTSCFESIYVCDARYFDLNAKEFCESVGATDLLFAVCTFTPAGPNCSYVSELF